MKFHSNDVIDTTKESRLFASLPLLLHTLSDHIDNESSGNFFIVTDDNASCRFALSNGKITHCAFKRHKGHAALEAILTSDIRGIARFMESQSPLRHAREVIDHDYAMNVLKIKKLDQNDTERLTTEDKQYMMYRGQRTERTTELPPVEATVTKPSTRMYRGQPI
ncbi:hypothetical protein [Leucothrix arctica]|uniref:Uncharacterized protein n=1 Tax=Leucothrix arctica TaxID=1481894 RepID=A0A317CG11_9GAMM|nr:hypothetical protein [Leucothrix arctica]PWQ97327.1 hypothetical protein DKT75_07250 [Leucothrix arctica]